MDMIMRGGVLLLFPTKFVEENEFLDALMVTAELSGYTSVTSNLNQMCQIQLFKEDDECLNTETISIIVSRRTCHLVASIYVDEADSTGFVQLTKIKEIESYQVGVMEALKEIMTWF